VAQDFPLVFADAGFQISLRRLPCFGAAVYDAPARRRDCPPAHAPVVGGVLLDPPACAQGRERSRERGGVHDEDLCELMLRSRAGLHERPQDGVLGDGDPQRIQPRFIRPRHGAAGAAENGAETGDGGRLFHINVYACMWRDSTGGRAPNGHEIKHANEHGSGGCPGREEYVVDVERGSFPGLLREVSAA